MVAVTMISKGLECCGTGLTRHVFIDDVRDGTKQVVVVAAEFVFEGTCDHDSKIPVEREQVALPRGGEVCGCVDGLSVCRNAEFIDTVIALILEPGVPRRCGCGSVARAWASAHSPPASRRASLSKGRSSATAEWSAHS